MNLPLRLIKQYGATSHSPACDFFHQPSRMPWGGHGVTVAARLGPCHVALSLATPKQRTFLNHGLLGGLIDIFVVD